MKSGTVINRLLMGGLALGLWASPVADAFSQNKTDVSHNPKTTSLKTDFVTNTQMADKEGTLPKNPALCRDIGADAMKQVFNGPVPKSYHDLRLLPQGAEVRTRFNAHLENGVSPLIYMVSQEAKKVDKTVKAVPVDRNLAASYVDGEDNPVIYFLPGTTEISKPFIVEAPFVSEKTSIVPGAGDVMSYNPEAKAICIKDKNGKEKVLFKFTDPKTGQPVATEELKKNDNQTQTYPLIKQDLGLLQHLETESQKPESDKTYIVGAEYQHPMLDRKEIRVFNNIKSNHIVYYPEKAGIIAIRDNGNSFSIGDAKGNRIPVNDLTNTQLHITSSLDGSLRNEGLVLTQGMGKMIFHQKDLKEDAENGLRVCDPKIASFHIDPKTPNIMYPVAKDGKHLGTSLIAEKGSFAREKNGYSYVEQNGKKHALTIIGMDGANFEPQQVDCSKFTPDRSNYKGDPTLEEYTKLQANIAAVFKSGIRHNLHPGAGFTFSQKGPE